MRTSVNFMPRSGDEFSLGDFVEVDLAELEYVLTHDGNTSVFVGKSLPSFGIEYKERKSDQRFGITPSLMHRYTSGTQLGIKLRSKLLRDWLILAVGATNGSSVTEQFHFSRRSTRTAARPSAAGRRSASRWATCSGSSPAIGWSWASRASGVPRTTPTTTTGDIVFAGLDLQYLGSGYALKAQVMRGDVAGPRRGPGLGPAPAQLGLRRGSTGRCWPAWAWWPGPRPATRCVHLAQERAYLTK